jgi:serine/threonine-protein kinase ATR
VENQILSKPDCQTVHYALSQFVNAPAVKGSRKPRILLTQAIRRFLNHTMDKQYLNMSVDPLGVWCAKSFQSSIRELRIVSSQALASYLKDSVPDGCRHRNRCNFLDLLRAIGNRGSLPHRETVALAWGLVGKICGEAELNFALLELVKDLGHPHPMVCGTSFHELRRLATDLGHTPLAMFAPFWRSIAPAVVKDILNCPQRVQQLSDLLGLKGGVDELLALTQSYTVPFLVLTKRHDVLQRLVQASYGTETVEQLITEPRKNLACVLALLLLESGNSEHTASVLLQEAAPNLKGRFVDLVKLDPMSPFCEILKAAGDHDDAKREKAYAAIDLLARLVKRKSRSQEISQPLADFLTEYILGIMAHFTDIVDNLKDQLSLSEKRRALTAIEHLLKLANSSHIDLAFPQVRATLQSAFDAQGLANEAFSAWVALIHGVQDTKVKDLIHHTFSIVIQKWDSFDHDSQIRAHNVLQGMIESHNTEIIENIGMMPHPRGIQMLEKLSTSIKNLRDRADLATLLDAFAVRCRDENVLVVRQALQELVPFLQETQNGVHDIINGQQVIPPVPKLYRSLLDTSLRFQEHDQEIVTLCSQCLGVLGCVDPNKVETVIDKRHILIKSNFDLLDEVVDFIAHMLETVLVEAFRSAPTGKQQSYLAYVMQELLQISGISDAARTGRAGTPKVALERWHSFPGSVRNTLIPYLSSKYCLTNPTVPADLKPFPASGPAPSHATWLRSLVFPLLHRGKGHNAKTIFPVISRVIQNHDLSISSFILPFIVQNIAASGTDYEIQFLKDEMNAILGYNVEGLTESEVENIRQCSEVGLPLFGETVLTDLECLSGSRLPIAVAAGEESATVCVYE